MMAHRIEIHRVTNFTFLKLNPKYTFLLVPMQEENFKASKEFWEIYLQINPTPPV
jgi:hypothetical protein